MIDWSLKGKLKTCDTKFFQVIPERGVTTVDVYLKEDIDRLRLELIDDLERLISIKYPKTNKLKIREIIAKRFGIKK